MAEFAGRYDIPLPDADHEAGWVVHASGLANMTIRDAAVRVVAEAGLPIHLSDLYTVLVAAGVRIGGKDPKNTLYGTIRGDERVANLGGNVWDLAERQEATPENRRAEEEKLASQKTMGRP